MPKSLTMRDKSIAFIIILVPVITIITNIFFTELYEDFVILRNVQADTIDVTEPVADKMAAATDNTFELKEKLEVADILVDHKKHNQANKALENILSADDKVLNRQSISLMRCRNSANAGWSDKAIQQYQQYLEEYENDYNAAIEYAGVRYAADKMKPESSKAADKYLELAEKKLAAAIELSPDKDKWQKMAIILSYNGKHTRALEALKNCRPISPADKELCLALTVAIDSVNTVSSDIKDMFDELANQLADIDKINIELLCPIARSSIRMGRADIAGKLFSKYLENEPEDRATRFEFANYLHNQKKYIEAETHYKILLEE